MLPRHELRAPIKWQVQLRAESGMRIFGIMVDLSSSGCCIQVENRPLRVGSRITVRPDGLDGLDAVVQWARGRQFGVVFDRPIYGPVLEHFVRKHSALAGMVSLS